MAKTEEGPLCACGCGVRTKGGKWLPGHDSRARNKHMGAAPPANVNKPKAPPTGPKVVTTTKQFRALDPKKITAGNLFLLHTLQGVLLGIFGNREFEAVDGEIHTYKEEKLQPSEIAVLAEDLTPYELNVPWIARGVQWLTDQDRHRRLATDLVLILGPRLYNHGLLPEEIMNGIAASVRMEEGGASVNSGGHGVGENPDGFAPIVGSPIHDNLAEQKRPNPVSAGSQERSPDSAGNGRVKVESDRVRTTDRAAV